MLVSFVKCFMSPAKCLKACVAKSIRAEREELWPHAKQCAKRGLGCLARPARHQPSNIGLVPEQASQDAREHLSCGLWRGKARNCRGAKQCLGGCFM